MTDVDHRALRIRLALTIGAESRLLGVARRTVERWDSGARPVSAEACRLLRLLELEHETGSPHGMMVALRAMAEEPATPAACGQTCAPASSPPRASR